MLKNLKRYTLQIIAGVNIVTAIIMLLIGMSDRLNPTVHSMLSNIGLLFPIFLIINFLFLVFFIFFKKKYIIISFLGYVVCFFPIRTYTPLNINGKRPDGALKVLSYNVYSFCNDGAPEDHPDPIIDYILEQDADIVCLQEGWLNDKINSLVEETYPYRDSVKNGLCPFYIVLLSKFPILYKERIKYKSEKNVSAAFKVLIEQDTVTVINNHFETSGISLEDRAVFTQMIKGKSEKETMKVESKRMIAQLSESSKIRAPQADAVARYVKECGGSIILCGDFNDSPISYTHRTLAKILTDCYVATGNGPGISYHGSAMFVRIDNIMCSADWAPYCCKVDRSIGYSDHYPIYCWLDRHAKNKK
ncbi:MAG: endonuclease/exonuclease/phosphatase family protein [Prevotella sp.]|nr:endonuclease/exonuclease/phosphatase family protein [Prevotella sp.]